MNRGSAVAVLLLKMASRDRDAGKSLAAILRAASAGAGKAVAAGGNFGAGVAEGLGAPAVAGRVIGGGAVIAGAGSVAGSAKRKVDEFRYRHGLYRQY